MREHGTPALTYETASALATLRVPIAAPAATVANVLGSLQGVRFDTASAVAICEDAVFRGLVPLEDVLAADPAATMRELMDTDPPIVAPGTDQEIAAWKAVRNDENAMAVVDGAGAFLGLIPAERMMGVLLWEHEEDLARLGGFARDMQSAREATVEPVARRLWHRLPWLFVGLAGAVAAADIVGAFEAQLEEQVLIAFFVPGIVYLADAVGTQTEAIIIRGLSVGVGIGDVVLRELLTGVLAGAAIGALFFPIGVLRWGETDIAAAVSIALLASCSVATVVAMTLPWALARAGRDPAFGSGPLATVVQDLLSIIIYFAVVSAVV
jgi:magnesium transporter